MDEFSVPFAAYEEEPFWEAGFEGDRRIVVARLGPFRRIFAQPKRYVRHFYHRVYELRIEDWRIPLEPLRLGVLCTIEAALSLRFQPTVKFARDHLDHLADLGGHIRASYHSLLRDAAEQALRVLETTEQLEQARPRLERGIEDLIHELLAIRHIQSRARCVLEITFIHPDTLENCAASVDGKHRNLYLELLRRRRETAEQLAREQYERQIHDQKLKLEHEERLLALCQREAELRRLQEEQATEQARVALLAEELRQTEHIDSEARRREEQLRQEAQLRQATLDAALADQQERLEHEMRQRTKQQRQEARLRQMEREAALVEEQARLDNEFRQREEQLRQEARRRQIEREAALADEQARLDSEFRQREEQLRQEARLRQITLETTLAEEQARLDNEFRQREEQLRQEARLRRMALETALAEEQARIENEFRQREEQLRQEAQLRQREREAMLAERQAQADLELRQREEQLRHEVRLRHMTLEVDLTEQNRRAEILTSVENHLHREIELLALERQRLVMEEEVHAAKTARAKGWVIDATRRFIAGDEEADAREADVSERPLKR